MKSICVYLGSNPGHRPEYAEAARALAREIVRRDLTLVYGGAKVGLMGILGDAAKEAGGRVVGILPKALMQRELAHEGLDDLHIVASMHERKALMEQLSDGFIAIPGGIGTLEEIFEVWTWGQLGDHEKPIGFLNVGGFYDALMEFLDVQRDEGFVKPAMRDMALVDTDPAALLDRFERYQPPTVAKWIGHKDR